MPRVCTRRRQVGKSIQDARKRLRRCLVSQPEEIVFTSAHGKRFHCRDVRFAGAPEKKHVITTRVEHSALIALGQHLEQKGYELTYLGVDSKGRLDLDETVGRYAQRYGHCLHHVPQQ